MAQAIATATTDQDALQSLLAGPATLHTNVSELARTWGWNRMRVLRRLRRWEDDGVLARQIIDDNTSIITITQTTTTVTIAAAPTFELEPAQAPARAVFTPAFTLPQLSAQRVVAIVMFALAGAVAIFGLRINAWYGASLARDAEAAFLLAGLSVVGDAVALLVPAVARQLTVTGQRAEARAAWAVYAIVMPVALMASIGFAAVNIADSTAGRDKTATQGAQLRDTIAQLTAERATLHEARPVAAIDAEILAQGPALAAWSRTHGCTDITRRESGDACAPIQRLRQARGEAVRMEQIRSELANAETQLAALPAVTAADPQADMAAALLHWVTGGLISASAHDIGMLRIIGMTLLPQISGLVLMLASGLWRQRR